MFCQRTQWGEIQWLESERQAALTGRQRVGVVTVSPGGYQPRHVHYEEQAIYVLEGEADSAIDGVTTHLTAGDLLHWKAGVVHEVHNRQDTPFRHLLISCPAAPEREAFLAAYDTPKSIAPDLIYIAAEAVRTQFLETLPYGCALFDALGNRIFKSQSFPEYCRVRCLVDIRGDMAECLLRPTRSDMGQEQVFRCRHGMEVYQYPITSAGHILGCLQAGYIRHSGEGEAFPGEVYDVPESVVTGVKALMGRIVKAIRNYCEFEQFRRELSARESEISSVREQHHVLEREMQDTRYAMTDLKINNHFLFNTLNSMASMALDGGQPALYQSIVDLSKLFRYTLRNQSPVVQLQHELDYVKAYLQLQKLRWDGQLHVKMEIDPAAAEQTVPFNFLQPIVENAFAHGFHTDTEKYLLLEAKAGDRLVICVTNSGSTLTEQEYFAVNQGIRSGTAHGLSMIDHKLRAVYGGDYELSIGPAGGDRGGSVFTISLPGGKEEAT